MTTNNDTWGLDKANPDMTEDAKRQSELDNAPSKNYDEQNTVIPGETTSTKNDYVMRPGMFGGDLSVADNEIANNINDNHEADLNEKKVQKEEYDNMYKMQSDNGKGVINPESTKSKDNTINNLNKTSEGLDNTISANEDHAKEVDKEGAEFTDEENSKNTFTKNTINSEKKSISDMINTINSNDAYLQRVQSKTQNQIESLLAGNYTNDPTVTKLIKAKEDSIRQAEEFNEINLTKANTNMYHSGSFRYQASSALEYISEQQDANEEKIASIKTEYDEKILAAEQAARNKDMELLDKLMKESRSLRNENADNYREDLRLQLDYNKEAREEFEFNQDATDFTIDKRNEQAEQLAQMIAVEQGRKDAANEGPLSDEEVKDIALKAGFNPNDYGLITMGRKQSVDVVIDTLTDKADLEKKLSGSDNKNASGYFIGNRELSEMENEDIQNEVDRQMQIAEDNGVPLDVFTARQEVNALFAKRNGIQLETVDQVTREPLTYTEADLARGNDKLVKTMNDWVTGDYKNIDSDTPATDTNNSPTSVWKSIFIKDFSDGGLGEDPTMADIEYLGKVKDMDAAKQDAVDEFKRRTGYYNDLISDSQKIVLDAQIIAFEEYMDYKKSEEDYDAAGDRAPFQSTIGALGASIAAVNVRTANWFLDEDEKIAPNLSDFMAMVGKQALKDYQFTDMEKKLKFDSLTGRKGELVGRNQVGKPAQGDNINESTLDEKKKIIGKEEGLSLTAYPDAGGYSIGYGSGQIDGVKVKKGDTITKEQADELLNTDIERHSTFKDKTTANLTSEQENALLSFEYNLGSNIWSETSANNILKGIETGNKKLIEDNIRKYIHSEGEVNKTLVARRERELKAILSSMA